jgi:signal transduction histidine kinase
MSLRSIRLRLLVFALLSISAGLAVAGLGMVALFGRHVERRVTAELDGVLLQLAGNLRTAGRATPELAREPSDPRFEQVFSGHYWQVTGADGAALLRSRSLWDSDLATVFYKDTANGPQTTHGTGPDGKGLIMRSRQLVLETNGAPLSVQVVAAVDAADVAAMRSDYAWDIVPGIGLLAIVLVTGAWLQIGAGLRPVDAVRHGVTAIRAGRRQRLDDEATPDEIAPLVSEVNALLDAQANMMTRARDRAADIAHGLKTPLAALAADILRLRENGQPDIALDIERLAEQMRRTVERELARSRLRHAGTLQAGVPLSPAVDGIVRTIKRTPRGDTVTWQVDIAQSLAVRIDRDDLNDVLGNLVENAVRHADTKVVIAASAVDGHVRIAVSDDGQAVEPALVEKLARRGLRQDAGGSSGLGLAIASDILAEHDANLQFDRAGAGGLEVSFKLDDATVPEA